MKKHVICAHGSAFRIRYIKPKRRDEIEVSRLLGLVLFFIGIGMVIGLLIAESVVVLIAAAACLMCGYHLFCR